MSEPSSPASGDEAFGKYRFIAALGQGGMADVYLAVVVGPAGFSKLQVIKRLRPSLAEEPDLRTMFLDEARLAARLNHRNVVQTNEVGLADGQYFIAMEYLDGQPYHRILAQSQKRGRPAPLAVLCRILCDVLAGLHYAHELTDYDGTKLHVVHRDISPQNVFVTYDGQVKIVDFGIAKAARRAIETQAGVIKGKVAYMAPEQAFSPSSAVDRRADVFSVGVMLWEAIAGRRLWAGMGDPEIIARMLQEVPTIRTVKPDVLPDLARVCERALARDPEERYPTAAALRADLEPLLSQLGDPRVTSEEIGALVSDLFAEPRAALQVIIDRRLALLQEEPPDPLPEPKRSRSDLPLIQPALLALAVEDDATTTREMMLASTKAADSARALDPTPGQGTLRAVLTPPERRARAVPLIAIALGTGAAVVGVAWVVNRGAKTETPSHPPAALTETTASSPLVSQAPTAPLPSPNAVAVTVPGRDTVAARISMTPTEGRIFLDGAALPQNPFEGRFVKDGAVHRIQFDAGGYLSQSRIVVFKEDVTVDVALLPKPTKSLSGEGPSVNGLPSKPNPYGSDTHRK